MTTKLYRLGPGNVVEEVPWGPMVAIDHAAMAIEGLLISFLSDHGFDSTAVSEKRKEISRRMAAYAVMTYASSIEHEVRDIAFPSKPQFLSASEAGGGVAASCSTTEAGRRAALGLEVGEATP